MPVSLAKLVLQLSLVSLLAGACHCTQECLYGLPTELPLPSEGSGTQPHLLDGTFLFPNITIQCYGRVTGVRFTGYFNPNVLYNATLSVRIQFYKAAGSHYELAGSANLVLDLEASLQTHGLQINSRGRYYVSSPLAINLQSSMNTLLRVSPGYILGVGLPPTESTPSGVVSHGVSIVVQNDTSSPAIDVMQDSCWNPSTKRSESCSVIRELVRPVVVLEFTKEGTAAPTTTPSSTPVMHQPSAVTSSFQTGLSSFYTAVGFACLFAFLFVLAAITVLVLVCVVVALSRRNRKSTALHAREQDCKEQGTAIPMSVIQGNSELGYEMIRPGGNGSAFGLPPTAENVEHQALTGPLSLGAGYERMYSSTRGRTPPAVYNQLQTLTPGTPAEYSIPRGVSSPPDYGKLSVEAQYTNPGQSCGGPLPPEAAGGTGPNEYAMVQQ